MDKSTTMSLKEYLTKKLSISMNVPLKTIDAVVSHQFNSAHEATKKNKSVEISGFGKFLFNEGKAKKMLIKNFSKKDTFEKLLQKEGVTEKKKESYSRKLENTNLKIEELKGLLGE
jgi:nucleoid DNA-binding protein